MKSSSTILFVASCLLLNCFMGCSLFRKSALQQKAYYAKFREPTFIVTFSWVSDDEKPMIENFFKNRKEARSLGLDELDSNVDFGYEIRLDPKDTDAIVKIFSEILKWNEGIINIGKDKKAKILGGDEVTVRLGYISTRATTGASAKMVIMPEPIGAKLFIDTKIPYLELHKNAVDGSINLNVEGRVFETSLPFSFIMENPRIYYYTSLNNITRYFYYDLKLEKQIEVFGITSESDFKYFQKNGKLPPRD